MCDVTPSARVCLPARLPSVGVARRFLSDHVCPRTDDDARDTAVLLVSELVTNAVLHGLPPIWLEVACTPSAHGLEVRVRDTSADRPHVEHPDPEAEHGRGVSITAILSDEWGVDSRDDGKTVWFRLTPGRASV